MTVLDAIRRSTAFLEQNGIDAPRLQSEHLIAHVLELPRMQLYLDFSRELSETELVASRKLVQERARNVPLQHLLGSVSFCGVEIEVNKSALIPRPETELLVEQAEAVLGESPLTDPKVLDFGTGTGCIAIALASRHPPVRLTALEVSPHALTLARGNAERHEVEGRIEFILGEGLGALPEDARFDVLVSNPPYIPSGEIDSLQPEVRDHDPRAALDGGNDGLDFYRMLAVEAGARLRNRGAMVLEFGDGQAEAITRLLQAEKWIVGDPLRDYSERERCLIAHRPA